MPPNKPANIFIHCLNIVYIFISLISFNLGNSVSYIKKLSKNILPRFRLIKNRIFILQPKPFLGHTVAGV